MKQRKILFIASQYNWMEPYTQSAVKSLWNDDCHLIFAVEKGSTVDDFNWLPKDKVTIYEIYKRPMIERKLFLLYPYKLISLINKRIADMKPDLVMTLTIETDLSHYLPKLQKRIPTIYMVHNARMHAKFLRSPWKRLKRKITYLDPQKRLNASMVNQITNARWQVELLKQQYPDHNVGYLPFPSLVTKEIAEGKLTAPKLVGESGYLLFFGRVEKYKGVERAVRLLEKSQLLADRKLVIAGKGELEIPIPESIADRVIWLNRYVDDSEVASLFRNAAVAVFPYVAASQSGVISIASYFGTPIVTSKEKFFEEIANGEPAMKTVDCDNIPEFETAVHDFCINPIDSSSIFNRNYSSLSWQNAFDAYLESLTL